MAALSFDSVIEDKDLLATLKRDAKAMSAFTEGAVADFQKVDDQVKKTAKGMELITEKTRGKKILDLSAQERSLLGFNQKLERTQREMGVTFTRASRDTLGFSSSFNASIDSAARSYQRFAGTAATETANISSSFKQLAGAAIGLSAAGALAQLPGQIVKVRGEFQNLEIAFTTMLGNKAKADKLMSEVVQLAATTPFGLKDAAAATKQLLAYGSASTEVIKELRMLGDVAAGVGAPIQDLTYLYGTLRAQGRAYAVDIRQFAGRGIPIYEELARVLGVATKEVRDLVEQGRVGFKDVQQAFQNMAGEGGKFFNLMDAQSKSLAGLSSQLSDAVNIMFNDMGRAQEGFLATTLRGAIGLVQNYERIIDALKVTVAMWGAYKAAVLLAAAATRANLIITEAMAVQQSLAAASGITLSAAQARAAATTVLLQRAQMSLNATMLANPYILAATALAGLIAYFAVYQRDISAVDAAQQRVANSAKAIGGEVAAEQAKVNTLVAEIKGLNNNRDKQAEKIRELIALNPSLLSGITAENIATKQGTVAIEQYIQAKARQLEIQQLEKEAIESQQRQGDLKKNGADLGFFDYIAAGLLTQYTQDTKKAFELKDDLTNKEIEKEKKIQEAIYGKIEAIAAVDAEVKKSGLSEDAAAKKTEQYYTDQIEALQKERAAKAENHAQYKKYTKDIEDLERKRAAITGKLSKEEKAAAKEMEKRGPMGSVAYWEYVKNAAEELLNKTPADNTKLVTARKQALVSAEAELEEARRKIATRSFEEEVEYKKKQYELYNAWVLRYGKESADAQFADLKTQGDGYAKYLQAEIDKLKSIADFTPLKDKDAERLSFLTGELDRHTGKESAMDLFKKSVDDAKTSSESLTETLIRLRTIQNNLGTPVNTDDYEKAKLVAEEIAKAERERARNLTAYVQSIEGSAAKELEITTHYNDLRAAVEAEYNAGRIKDRKKTLEQIDKSERDEITETKLRAVEGTKAFRDLNIQTALTGEAALKDRVDKERSALHELEIANLQYTDRYKEQVERVKAATKDLADYNKAKFQDLADSISSLGEAVSSLGGDSGSIVSMLGNLAAGVGKVNTALDKNKEATKSGETNYQGYIQAAQTAVQLVGMVIQASKERKRAEAEYYNAIMQFESEYALALNKRIRLQAVDDENMFVMDYQGRIDAGVKAYQDAQKRYLDAVERVASEGKAKSDQKNKVDWGKVGSGAASGAAAGAAFGPWGAAIGGVIGAAVGFFGGKKKKDVYTSIGDQFNGIIEVGSDGFKHLNKEMAQAALNSGLLDDKTKALVSTALAYADAMEEANDQIEGVLQDLVGSIGDDLKGALVDAFSAGEDSALAFKKVVANVIQGMITDLLYAQIFKSLFDDLEKDLKESASIGGDGVFTDDIIRFMQASGPAVEQFNEALAAAQAEAEKYGLDIYGNGKKPEAPKSMTGEVATISQQSANELNGSFNAMRITQAQMLVVTTNQLFELQRIATNTASIPELVQLSLQQLIYLRNLDQPLSRYAG